MIVQGLAIFDGLHAMSWQSWDHFDCIIITHVQKRALGQNVIRELREEPGTRSPTEKDNKVLRLQGARKYQKTVRISLES